jgi:signal transduction histidine kinase
VTRPWFLHRRITYAFGLTTLLLSLALSVPFAWMVHSSIQDEIDALAREELDETRAYFINRQPTPEAFAPVAVEMEREHPENPMAWRIWRRDGQVWGEFGARELLAPLGPEPPLDAGIRRLSDARRLSLGPLGGGLMAAVVLEARTQSAGFQHFLLVALAFVSLATGVATLAGRRLARHVSGLLAAVAASARTENAAETWVPPSAAPEEIRAVVLALQDTLRRIREEDENARLLVSGLAHELRSPLQNLMGETQVALLREREAGEYRRVLESQLEDLGELSRVVDNLVTLSSLEEALRRRSVERFDLGAEAQLRLSRELALASRRGVTLELESEGALLIDGDREALLLALRNLVTNAIEWSPQGKKVAVRMHRVPGGLEILVDDAGPGVPVEERERIFRPFHRGPAAQGRRVGFGLGLALTHSAVRAQGGRIEVGESPLGGARFRILLPLAVAS